MLLGNSTVLNKSPMRKFAGTTESAERSNFGNSGARRNFQLQASASTANQLYALPQGAYAGLAWFLPQKIGAIASRDAPSLSVVSGLLAGGKNLVASAEGLSDATGTITMLAYGVGQSTGISTASGSIYGTAPLVGGSAGLSTVAGFLSATLAVVGQSDGTSSASGSVSGALSLSGSAASASAATGGLFAGAFVSGQSDSASTPGGFVFGVRYATGAADSTSLAGGAVTALGWLAGGATGASGATLQPYATGVIGGESTTVQSLSPDGLARAVWNSVAAQYGDNATMGAKLNSAASGGVDYAALGLAVWEHAQRSLTSEVNANMVKVNGVVLQGTGVAGNPMRPA